MLWKALFRGPKPAAPSENQDKMDALRRDLSQRGFVRGLRSRHLRSEMWGTQLHSRSEAAPCIAKAVVIGRLIASHQSMSTKKKPPVMTECEVKVRGRWLPCTLYEALVER